MIKTNKVAAATLGCKVNMYDTEAVLKLFSDMGYQTVNFEEFADVYIINTCTVTNLSDKKSRQMIRRARKLNSNAIIVATGCYAQTSPNEVGSIEGIDIVTGTANRGEIVSLVESFSRGNKPLRSVASLEDNAFFESLEINSNSEKTRAYIKIQDGCNQFCTYCIIPYARGTVRSRKPSDVLLEAERLAANGYKEIVFVGIHVASYGKDLAGGEDLFDLLLRIHEIDGLDRIRLSSLDPRFITDRFLSTIKALPKLCSHFHLSLQSGCDKTLIAMNRKYTREDYKKAVHSIALSRPNSAVTTDVIVGFPGETDCDFDETFKFVSELELAKIHVFPYSPRSGTPAANYDNQVSDIKKRSRADKMLELSDKLSLKFCERFIGKTMYVLFESQVKDNIFEGHTENYITVRVESDIDIINQILLVKLSYVDKIVVYGEKMS